MTDIKPHYGIEPTVRFLTLLVAATGALWSRALLVGALLVGTLVCKTAFGVFFGLKVSDFDLFFGFLVLVLHLVFLWWVVGCLWCVSDTEQQLMPARDVLFWNQVIQTNQFLSLALRPLIS